MSKDPIRLQPNDVKKYSVIRTRDLIENPDWSQAFEIVKFELSTDTFDEAQPLKSRYVEFRDKTGIITGYLKLNYFDELCNQWYRLYVWGSHNAVYFPIDPKNNAEFLPPEKIDSVFKVPLADAGNEDSPQRTARLLENATLSSDGFGTFIPYYHNIKTPTVDQKIKAIYDYFQETGRVIFDGLVPGNIIVYTDKEGNEKTIVIDRGDAFSFFPPNDPNVSIVSLETMPAKLLLYVPFLKKYAKITRDGYQKIACFTEALITLSAFELKLRSPNRFLNQPELIQFLANLFENAASLTIPDTLKNHFTPASLIKMQQRNTFISRLGKKFHLSDNEKQLLRLNPALYAYEEPMADLHTILPTITQPRRFDLMTKFCFCSEKFNDILMMLSVLPNDIREKSFENCFNLFDFSTEFDMYFFAYLVLNYDNDCFSDRRILNLYKRNEEAFQSNKNPGIWFSALKMFINDYHFSIEEACDALSNIKNENNLNFLCSAYPYGVRKEMLEHGLIYNNPLKQNILIQLFDKVGVDYFEQFHGDKKRDEFIRFFSLPIDKLCAILRDFNIPPNFFKSPNSSRSGSSLFTSRSPSNVSDHSSNASVEAYEM